LTLEVETYRQFEEMLGAVASSAGRPDKDVAKRVANWILSERPGVLRAASLPVTPPKNTIAANLALVVAVSEGMISGGNDKEILAQQLSSHIDPGAFIASNKQTSDTGAIEAAVDK